MKVVFFDRERAFALFEVFLCVLLFAFSGSQPLGFVISYLILLTFAFCKKRNIAKTALPVGFQSFILVLALELAALFAVSLLVRLLPFPNESAQGTVTVSAVVLAPIFEEMFWRASVKGSLDSLGSLRAAVVSSICFALMHSSPKQMCYAYLAGMIFSFGFDCSGSVLPCIAAHFINNALSAIGICYPQLGSLTVIVISAVCIVIIVYFAFSKSGALRQLIHRAHSIRIIEPVIDISVIFSLAVFVFLKLFNL